LRAKEHGFISLMMTSSRHLHKNECWKMNWHRLCTSFEECRYCSYRRIESFRGWSYYRQNN